LVAGTDIEASFAIHCLEDVMLPTDFRRLAASTIVVASAFSAVSAAETPQLAFSRSWEGRQVRVKRALYTLVYNEKGRLGNTYSGRREGLTVLTPYDGIYFQFEGRQGRQDVVVRDPQQIIDAVAAEYQGDTLDVRSSRKVEPLLIARYDAGVALVVTKVWFERDTVRLILAESTGSAAKEDSQTAITVRWPAPLSRSLSERQLIEGLLSWFIEGPDPL
jgi:hypothetical protein